jgi:GDPmannose 4,6-dehydratase
MLKKVLITGLTGQDGSYMAEHLLAMPDIEVYGMVRRTAQIHDTNFRHLLGNPRLKIVRGDLSDGTSLATLVKEIKPDYFINLAAQSFVADSWLIPEETFMTGAVGVLKCLEAIRKYHPTCRFYNAGSSEQFGDVIYTPQDEEHPFRPRSPYGAAKCAAHHLVKVYRESYNLYALQGLLFNHESERRGGEFVTRKITKGLARIRTAIQRGEPFEPIVLGNIDAKRDWSHASDFVDAIWRMLNQELHNPALLQFCQDKVVGIEEALPSLIKEYVIASGEAHTVREFIDTAVEHLGFDTFWDGEGVNEQLAFTATPRMVNMALKSFCLVKIDKAFYRPADVTTLLGTPKRAVSDLGWRPKISFDILVKRMLESDLNESGFIDFTVRPCCPTEGEAGKTSA